MEQFAVFYLLVFTRVLGLFSAAPWLGNSNMPRPWKLLLACCLTFVMGSWMVPRPIPFSGPAVVLGLLWEMLVGFTLGLIASLSLGAALSAGTLVDFQVGFANSGLLNPASGRPEPLTATFYHILIVLLGLTLNLHLELIRILAGSFERFPVALTMQGLDRLLAVGQEAFAGFLAAALWLALPVSLTLLAAEIAVAFLSRLMPQMNMLIAAAPLRVLMGLAVTTAALPTTLKTMTALLDWSFGLARDLVV